MNKQTDTQPHPERQWQLVSLLLGFVVVMLMSQKTPAPSGAQTPPQLPFANAVEQRARQIELLESIDRRLEGVDDQEVAGRPEAAVDEALADLEGLQHAW